MQHDAEIEREHAEQDRTDQRGPQHDTAARDQRRKARADADRDRENHQEQRDGVLVAADRFFTIGGSSDSTTMPTSQNQLVTSAPHHSRGSHADNAASPRSRRRYWRGFSGPARRNRSAG